MKKKAKIILAVILCLVIIVYFVSKIIFSTIEKDLIELKNINILNIDLSTLEDGKYQGKFEMFPIKVLLEVTINSQRITDIKIIEHENGQGRNAESIIENVIDKQSLQVDTISGATYSSKAILKAIENALTK